jgi:hypothetical protein
MQKKIDEFVKKIFKNRNFDTAAKESLRTFLYEKVEDLKDNGYSEEEAVTKTINDFGDPEKEYLPDLEDSGLSNLKKERKRTKNALLFSFLSSLLIIAIIMVFNFVFLPEIGPWSIIVSLGVLFWPLSLLYKLLNKKGE